MVCPSTVASKPISTVTAARPALRSVAWIASRLNPMGSSLAGSSSQSHCTNSPPGRIRSTSCRTVPR